MAKYCPGCGAVEAGKTDEGTGDNLLRKLFGDQPRGNDHKPDCESKDEPAVDCFGWDALKAAGKTPKAPRPFGPHRDGSSLCRSGSLAAGGKREYCTCDTCF